MNEWHKEDTWLIKDSEAPYLMDGEAYAKFFKPLI